MSDHSGIHISRRDALKIAGATAAVGLMTACGPTPTPTPVPAPTPTKPPVAAPTTAPAAAPTATKAPAPTPTVPQVIVQEAIPTPRVGPPVHEVNWDMYPKEDPRHWLVDKMIEPPKKYKDLVTTQNYDLSNAVFKEGEKPDDNVKSRWLQAQMGLTYKAVWSGQIAQYWGPALASGDLPEYITNVPMTAYLQLREGNMLAEISDIWEKTASPLTKKKKRYPDFLWWKVYNEKGKFYSIPSSGAGAYNGENGLWVRKDWLAKVKLDVPQTLDQVYEVAKAFIKDGLSKYGIWFGYPPTSPYTGVATCDFVFGAFGTMPRIWQRASDGKLSWSSLNPLQKDALVVLAKWYKDGILDPDWMTQNDAAKYLGGNQFGMGAGAWWYSVWALRTSVANDPTADWTFTIAPAGPGGKRGRWGDPMTGTTTCFRKGIDPIKIEAVINTLNWWYEIEDNNVTATTGGTLVFLGYDYVMEGDKAVHGKFITTRYNPGGLDFNLKGYPEFDNVGYNRGALQFKMDEKLLNPLQVLWSRDPQILLGAAANNAHFRGVPYRMVTDFVWPPPTAMLETIQALAKLEDEAYANIITGKQPVSAWDTFVQDWKKQGGDKLTEAINAEDAKRK